MASLGSSHVLLFGLDHLKISAPSESLDSNMVSYVMYTLHSTV